MSERMHSLDLLRGVAAFGVAIPHIILATGVSSPILEGLAVTGVEIFFVLSGFVLAPQLLSVIEEPRNLPTFLMRRWMRTVPPYLVALVAMSLVAGMLGTGDFLRYAFYLQNLVTQRNSNDDFTIAWSLSVEEWFYIVFPLVLLAGSAFLPKHRARPVMTAVGFILLVTIFRVILGNTQHWGENVRRVVAFRVDAIAYGFILSVCWPRLLGIGRAIASLLGTGIAIGACLWWIATTNSWTAENAFPLLAAAFGSASIIVAMSAEPLVSKRPWLRALSSMAGRISYSVYLFHSVLAAFVLELPLKAGFRVGLSIMATALFAAAFFYAFERPILAARPRYGQRMRRQPMNAVAVPLANAASTDK